MENGREKTGRRNGFVRFLSRLARIFTDAGLRKKMILLYLFAIFIPVLSLGAFYLNRTRSIVKAQSSARMINELSLTQQRLDVMISSVEEVSSMLAYDKDLISAVNAEYDSLIEARDAYTAVWNRYTNLQINWPYLRNLTIYFDNPSLVSVRPYLIDINDYMKDNAQYERIMATGTIGYWSGIQTAASGREYWFPQESDTGDSVLAYSRVISSSNNVYNPKEILTVEIYASQLEECLPLHNESFIFFLVDSKGGIIRSTEGYGEAYLQSVPGYAELLGGEKRYAEYEVAESDTQIASYSKMDNGWKLLICMPLGTVMEPHREILRIGMLFLGITTLISLSIILLFSSSISNRVSRLIRKMEKFMDGSFQIDPLIEGKDEIGKLDSQFTVLAENLKSTIQEQYILKLQRTKAQLEVLQTQVNPHFLYNALSTINWLVEKGDLSVVRLAVESLAKFYQINLSKGRDIKVWYTMIKSRGEKVFDVINVVIMIIIALVMLYPFLNVLAISLNDAYDSLAGGITIFPRKFTVASYQSVMKYENLFSAFWVSAARTVITTVLALILTSITAFALTKRVLPGYNFFYYFFIVSMFLPVLLIPCFMLYKQLHIYNTFLVYILPGLFATNNMILFRTFIIQLPAGLEESTYLDGANEFTVFFRIVLPLCKPILATIGLFVAVMQWNAWQDTLYYVTNTNLETLQFVLMKVIKQAEASAIASEDKTSKLMQLGGNTVTPNSIKMAITIIATVPIICVYPFLQKYFVKGMMVGAVKG